MIGENVAVEEMKAEGALLTATMTGIGTENDHVQTIETRETEAERGHVLEIAIAETVRKTEIETGIGTEIGIGIEVEAEASAMIEIEEEEAETEIETETGIETEIETGIETEIETGIETGIETEMQIVLAGQTGAQEVPVTPPPRPELPLPPPQRQQATSTNC